MAENIGPSYKQALLKALDQMDATTQAILDTIKDIDNLSIISYQRGYAAAQRDVVRGVREIVETFEAVYILTMFLEGIKSMSEKSKQWAENAGIMSDSGQYNFGRHIGLMVAHRTLEIAGEDY